MAIKVSNPKTQRRATASGVGIQRITRRRENFR